MLRGKEATAAAIRWAGILEQLHLIGLCRRLPVDFRCSCAPDRGNWSKCGKEDGGEEG